MNTVVIFAGGVGSRMKTQGIPKQFLKINGMPIIIHTLKAFEDTEEIDAIVVSCLETHINELKGYVNEYGLKKVQKIVPGGRTSQESIINGLIEAKKASTGENDIVLIHDGVRPIIDEDLIKRNIEAVQQYGSSISCAQQKETTILSENGEEIMQITDRAKTWVARAPQAFFLDDILEAQRNAVKSGDINCVDSCTVMKKYGKIKNPHITRCDTDNIKITTPDDYYIAESLINARKWSKKINKDTTEEDKKKDR